MALVLSGERPAAAAVLVNPLHLVGEWFAKLRTRNAQRQALADLLNLESCRLDDLGINRGDLFDALQARRATRLLGERRALRHHY
ncbi:MAG TPA: hypothetical protein VHZ56_07430 [Devosia sp.]|jgi:uncharacterized protein YjiS (DUF1127 family)|nr:hypothetical protein [Devosia sp.]